VADHSGIVLPLANKSIGAHDAKEKKPRPTGKVKDTPIPKPTASANGKAIEPLQAAQEYEDKSTDSRSVRQGRKNRTHAVTKQAQGSGDKETAQTGLEQEGLLIDSKPARTNKKKKNNVTKHSKASVKTEAPAADGKCDEKDSTKASSPVVGRGRTRRVHRKGNSIKHVLPEKSLIRRIKFVQIRTHASDSKTGEVEALKTNLMATLQGQNLSRQDRKHLMRQLRHSLLLGANKIPDLRNKDRKAKKTKKSRPGSTNSSGQLTEKPGMTAYEIKTVNATDLELVPIEKSQPPVPNLAYGLERVLFNPGVYHLRDPRSRVFNFDPYLESIMPVADFDFDALKEYITSSRDETLLSAAAAENKKYTGSTSSMTSALAHFHFLLSQWRPINISNLSQGFPETLRTFTQLQRAPSAIFLRWRNGTYAIDADKEFDTANILMMLGKSMEKLLTLPTQDFEKYRKVNSGQIAEDERNAAESFHYTTMGDFLMRSQLDAYDPRIPGTGMFDLKTRAVVSIRMDARNYHNGLGYEIRSRHGEFESYEREYYDMIRAAFLKYSLQVRMGRMDGIFVAFHNTERIFGFQYISLPEMDLALHGKEDVAIGDAEFKLSLELLNRVLDRATAKFPGQSLRLFFETRDAVTPFMYIFAEPVTEEDIQRIQESKKAEIEDYERTVLGIQREATPEEIRHEQEKAEWEELQAKVEDSMDNDELEPLDESETPHGNGGNTAAIDLDSPDSCLFDAKNLDSAAQPLDGHVSMLDAEVEQVDEGDTELEGEFDEQFQHSIVGNAADNQEHEDISHSTAEGENDSVAGSDLTMLESRRIEEHRIDAPALHNGVETIHEDADEASADLKAGETSEAAKLDATDQESKHDENSTKSNNDLLAMTLTIRNKVNGAYVVRPEDFGPNDRWSVEYALAEVPTLEQSRTLYDKTQRRRALILRSDKNDVKSRFREPYARKLAELSSQGRKWREEQNDIDREKPVKVLGDQIDGS
jgi:hypothetical protein